MNKIISSLAVAAISVSLVACDNVSKQDVGVASGAIAGGLIGSTIGGGGGQMAAIGIGAIAGAIIGGEIGKSMDRQDQMIAMQAMETVPTGRTKSWTNPDSGRAYEVTPVRTYYRQARACREYNTQVIIDGRRQTMVGQACRNPDGTWSPMN
jgi:surface antigen